MTTDILQFSNVDTLEISPDHIVCSILEKFFQSTKDPILVSLSGGVDSMVITRCLIFLKEIGIIDNEIYTLHINYNNRNESFHEAAYLEKWCTSYKIPCYQTVITNIKRGVTPRILYEKQARTIRFSFYKDMLDRVKSQGIILGHHKGDVRENVISNLMKGVSLTNLSGMKEISNIEGVNIWRPLLPITKDHIYDFAHHFGVPYFKDTTPEWSTRGKLRNQVIPTLTKTYGNIGEKLSNISQESDELFNLMTRVVFEPFRDTNIIRNGKHVSILYKSHVDTGYLFWREILLHECRLLNVKSITNKSLIILVDKMSLHASRVQKMTLNKSLQAIIHSDTLILQSCIQS